ncbi:DUF2304 domain-containing protein [Methanobrevibacter oralis]|uniref:DUF2304 domain-containing protein n=1 Tax=Methanobrevibacter oralis TaxID=66851 RepID=A0A166AFY8_METOA|nr:DUF2304 family protein [Methanobrevibacter oralis]KZX11983.1 hypothetical protein MBORA_13420 [Methanobrevibacter oralis]
MLLYSIILPIIAILAIVSFAYRYLNERISLFTLSLWNIFWIFVIVFSIFPNSSMIFAKIFGINRGLDFIIMVAFVVLFYIIFKLYFKLDKMQEDMNELVKEIALNNEIQLDEEE